MDDVERKKTYAVHVSRSLYPCCRTADPRMCSSVGNRPWISAQRLGLIALNVDFQPFPYAPFVLLMPSAPFGWRLASWVPPPFSLLQLCRPWVDSSLPFTQRRLPSKWHVNMQVVGRMFVRHYNNFCALVWCPVYLTSLLHLPF